MLLSQEHPDYSYALRSADGQQAKVNEQTLERSFVIAPDQLLQDWTGASASELTPADIEPLLAMNPAVILLGTGERQNFPSAEVLAACLTRGIGIEVMSNDAAARTYNVLASEGRRVVAGFLLSP